MLTVRRQQHSFSTHAGTGVLVKLISKQMFENVVGRERSCCNWSLDLFTRCFLHDKTSDILINTGSDDSDVELLHGPMLSYYKLHQKERYWWIINCIHRSHIFQAPATRADLEGAHRAHQPQTPQPPTPTPQYDFVLQYLYRGLRYTIL